VPCDVPQQEDLLATDLPLFPLPGPLLRLSAVKGVVAISRQNNGSLMIHDRVGYPRAGVLFGLFRVRL